jgi:hypothetical protein
MTPEDRVYSMPSFLCNIGVEFMGDLGEQFLPGRQGFLQSVEHLVECVGQRYKIQYVEPGQSPGHPQGHIPFRVDDLSGTYPCPNAPGQRHVPGTWT